MWVINHQKTSGLGDFSSDLNLKNHHPQGPTPKPYPQKAPHPSHVKGVRRGEELLGPSSPALGDERHCAVFVLGGWGRGLKFGGFSLGKIRKDHENPVELKGEAANFWEEKIMENKSLEISDFAEIVRLKNPVCEQSNLGLSDWHAICLCWSEKVGWLKVGNLQVHHRKSLHKD